MTPASAAPKSSNHTTEKQGGTNVYRTHDLFLAAFLQALGHQLVEVFNQGGRGTFVFEDSDKLRRDILSWSNNIPVPLPARAFLNSTRDLKGLIAG